MFTTGFDSLDGTSIHRRGAETDAFAGLSRKQQVGSAEERRDKARGRPGIQLVGLVALQQAAEIHDTDAVGEREGFFLVMRHQHGSDAELALDLADRAPEFLADLGVERTERFIEQQHFGLVRERTGHGHSLLLAAGQLRRQAIVHTFECDQAQQLLATLAAVRGLHAPDPQGEFDVVRHAHVAKQGVVLEHEADATVACRHMRNVTAVKGNPPMIHAGQAGDGTQQRALATAAWSEQDVELAVADVQRHIVDDRGALIPLGDLIERDGHEGRGIRWGGAKVPHPTGWQRLRQSPGGNKMVITVTVLA